jgi:hypothetical protein
MRLTPTCLEVVARAFHNILGFDISAVCISEVFVLQHIMIWRRLSRKHALQSIALAP